MSENINLLPSRAKFQAKRMALKLKIGYFSWIFGGVWLVLLLVILGGFYVSQFVLSQVNKKYQTTLGQYKTLVGSMVVNQQVKYQAKVVGQILEGRFEYGDSIEAVKSLFTDKVNIEDIQIEGKKQFVLSGSVEDGNYMGEVEEKLKSINGGGMEQFSGAVLKDVDLDSGVWKFKMEVTLR